MTIIKSNSKAVISRNDFGNLEVFIRISDKRFFEPRDENFGVWAWSAYTMERAEEIFEEITTGERTVTPMTEFSF